MATIDYDRCPQPPSAAYEAVAQHLLARYFTTPPPADGIELIVTHRSDNKTTRWIFTHSAADMMEIRLRKDPMLIITRQPWTQTRAAA